MTSQANIVNELISQRNDALNNLAVALAEVNEMRQEVVKLKKELEDAQTTISGHGLTSNVSDDEEVL